VLQIDWGYSVGSLKTVIDWLAQHQFLIYFVILWGASMFLYAIANFVEWGFDVEGFYDVLWILANLFDLASGALLMLFGIKLMNKEFLEGITTEKTLVYFLLLWAGQFFFWGLSDLTCFEIVWFLAGLAYLFAGIILALFAWRLLNEKETTLPTTE
jgi:hypothetical protein